jgi:hypothetical protein
MFLALYLQRLFMERPHTGIASASAACNAELNQSRYSGAAHMRF